MTRWVTCANESCGRPMEYEGSPWCITCEIAYGDEICSSCGYEKDRGYCDHCNREPSDASYWRAA